MEAQQTIQLCHVDGRPAVAGHPIKQADCSWSKLDQISTVATHLQ
jgi:hypothetical protein